MQKLAFQIAFGSMAVAVWMAGTAFAQATQSAVRVKRLLDRPIITPQLHPSITSPDGIRFQVRPEVLGRTYMRAFKHDGYTYAMAMPGQFYRSRDGLSGFEEGPRLFNADMRHAALLKRVRHSMCFGRKLVTFPSGACYVRSISPAIGRSGPRAHLSKCCVPNVPGKVLMRRSHGR